MRRRRPGGGRLFPAAAAVVAVLARTAEPAAAEGFVPPAPEGRKWALAWSDEFDGGKLDETKWDVPEYKRRDAHWSRDAVEVKKGKLVIKAFEKDGEYYDACVRTRGRFEHAFGYYVARMKLQKRAGHWSAFWMFNDSVGKVGDGGMDGTEIDIMEKPWLDDRVTHNLHWDGYGEEHESKGRTVEVEGVMKGWHEFALLWTPDEYVFYVDGKETWRTDAGGVCQVPLYLKISDEIEFGGWAGDIRKEKLPDAFYTDYVRVYDLVDAGTGEPVMRPRPAGAGASARPE